MSRFTPIHRITVAFLLLVTLLLLAACMAPVEQVEADLSTVSPATTADIAASNAGSSDSSEDSVVEPEEDVRDVAESPACSGLPTSANQEGPYYSPGSPERANLVEEGMSGSPVRIAGQVFDNSCNPIAGAKLDFWQADFDGAYDNQGYTLRGHVFTDEDGAFALESIEPGPYTGRPPHIHVKVFDPSGQELLTTQIYTSGSEDSADVRNAPDLLATYVETDAMGVKQVLFDFVVEMNE